MMMRRLCLAVALLGPGCQVLLPDPGQPALNLSDSGHNSPAAGNIEGDPVEGEPALAPVREEVLEPGSDLAKAAACLERGDEAAACDFLAKHIAEHPNHVSLRAQLAELLMHLKRLPEARDEFERFAAVAQERGEGLLPLLVHAHSRLLELAEGREDDYQMHLQRGLGLYWLARRSSGDSQDAELPAEGLYFKAAAELIRAHHLRPEEARPCWYLYLIWRDLARQQFARRWLRDTRELAVDSYLTSGEQRRLHLACQALDVRR